MIIGYFEIHQSGEIAIVEKSFYDVYKGLDGDGLSEQIENALPDGFYSLAESIYEYCGSGDPRQLLIDSGFEEKTIF